MQRSISPRTQAELAQSTTETLTAEIEGLQAQLSAQMAAIDGIRLDLDYTRIGAPVEGVVTAIVAQRGQTLNANQQAPVILRLSRDNPLMLVLRIPEADAERVRAGMRLRFALLGGSSKTFESTIRVILRSPTIINDVIYYDAIAYLDGGIDQFAFGRTVQAFVVVESLACALHLPRSLLPVNTASENSLEIAFLKPGGGVMIKKVRLEALNDVSGGIDCEQAEKLGISPLDRLVRATPDGFGAR